MSAAEDQDLRSLPPRWTPEEDTRLLELRGWGLSTRRIATALGRTPSSVENRAYRLRWRIEAETTAVEDKARERWRVVPRTVPPARTCQYIGDQGDDPRGWSYCGRPCMEGRSYCAEHSAICYDG